MEVINMIQVLDLFDKIKINIDNQKIDLKINENIINDFEYRFLLQKINYLFQNSNINIIDNFNFDYSWYVKGVYSQKLANLYYDIAYKRDILENLDLKSDTKEKNEKANNLLNKIIIDFKIKDLNKFKNILNYIIIFGRCPQN